tara:strand:- start:551 stop:913 length:363 start_codon:yes stop_codon:yes gene_type:complete
MALIMIITQYSEAGFKSVALGESGDRLEANKAHFKILGAELIAQYFSTTDGYIYTIIEGDPSIIPMMHFTSKGTGGFQHMEAKLLIESHELFDHAKKAGELFGTLSPPNRDEIDRMLLDE